MKKLLATVCTFALALTACQQAPSDTDTTADTQEPIKIGYLGPLTGDAAAYGTDTFNATKIKVDEINAAGGINGRTVQLIPEDGRCTGTDAAGAAQKLINVDKVVAIVGGQCSGETLAAAPIAEAAQVVVISPVSTSPDVTNAGDFIFRTAPSDELKTKAMASYFSEQGFTKVAIITENTDFAVAFRDALKKHAGADKFVFDELVEPGHKDFRTLMTRLQDVEFDIFVTNGNSLPLMGAMLDQLREQGLEQPTITHDAGETQIIIDIAPVGTDGLRAINVPAVADDSVFGQKYIAAYGPAQASLAFAGAAYDAMAVLSDAIAAVGTDGPAIRDYLYGVKDYDGVIATFSFDANGDVMGINYSMTEVQNKKFVKIRDIVVN